MMRKIEIRTVPWVLYLFSGTWKLLYGFEITEYTFYETFLEVLLNNWLLWTWWMQHSRFMKLSTVFCSRLDIHLSEFVGIQEIAVSHARSFRSNGDSIRKHCFKTCVPSSRYVINWNLKLSSHSSLLSCVSRRRNVNSCAFNSLTFVSS